MTKAAPARLFILHCSHQDFCLTQCSLGPRVFTPNNILIRLQLFLHSEAEFSCMAEKIKSQYT